MEPHHPKPAIVAVEQVTVSDLHRIRGVVTRTAATVGLTAERVAHLALAVSEITTNAIRYGGGAATVTLSIADTSVIIDVQDSGPGLVPDVAPVLPEPDAIRGRGLWLVQQLCDRVEIVPSAAGTLVRLIMTAARS